MHNGSLFEKQKIKSILSFAEFCLARSFPAFPLEVFLEISNVCNLKCTMCTEFSQINPYRLEILKLKKRGFINPEDIDENIVPLLEHALFVNSSGFGEPTVHPRFAEIIEYISQYDVLIRFITNGQHLTPQLINTLVENSVYKIMVSCSGSTREHYEQVYIGGSFDVLLENLRLLKEVKEQNGVRYPIVEINSLGFKHHVATFDTFVELMGDYGANIIHLKKLQPYAHIPELYEHVSLMRPWIEGKIIEKAIAIGKDRGIVVGVDEYAQNTVLTDTEYQDATQQLQAQSVGTFAPFGKNDLSVLSRIVRSRRDFSDQLSRYPFIEMTSSSEETAKILEIRDSTHSKKFFCMEPFKTMYIRTGGEIKPCCFSSQSVFLGSVKRDSGNKVWQGVGFEAVRHGIVQEKYPSSMCSRCLKDRIGPTDHFVHSLALDYIDWYAERYDRDLQQLIDDEFAGAIDLISNSPSQVIIGRWNGNEPIPEPIRPPDGELRAVLDSASCRFEGVVERVIGRTVYGWCWARDFPTARLPVTVWQDEKLVGKGTANRNRTDLLEAGKGDGRHGFSILLPRNGNYFRTSDIIVTIGDKHGKSILPTLTD